MLLPQVYLNRKQEADKIVEEYIAYTIGAGLIPIPLLDTVTIAGLQFAMVKQLSEVYEVNFREYRLESVMAVLLGSVGTTVSIYKFFPGIGRWLGGVRTSIIGGVYTYALGKFFTQHFELGGTLQDFDAATSKAFFKQELEEGKNILMPRKAKKKRQKQLVRQLVEDRKQLLADLSQLQKELRNFNAM